MILFILEGERPDVKLYQSMMEVCGVSEDTIDVVYGCNIDALYHEMVDLGEGADIVELLRNKYQEAPNNPFKNISRSDKFSEIYLVFDYDFHDVNRTPELLNKQLGYLLNYFNEETEHGKLYINYPMIEAIRYSKELPDNEYYTYSVSREECRTFKHISADFSFYPNLDFLIRGDSAQRSINWELLKRQNVAKANFICNGENVFPPKSRDSISQAIILENQILKYEACEDCRVAVLSSFPILLYDWTGR